MKAIRATCVIPVYNVEKYIEDLLESIPPALDKLPSDVTMNFVFVNDASPGNETAVIKEWIDQRKFMPWHQFWIMEHNINRGLAASRNTGLNFAKLKLEQDYFMWMDSDDIFTPESFKSRLQFMYENPDIDYAYASYLTFRGDIRDKPMFGNPDLPEFDYMHLFAENIFSSCGAIIKADKIWGNMFDENIRICEDYDFNLRAGLCMKIAKIGALYAFLYRLRDSNDLSLSFDPNEQRHHVSNNRAMKRRILKYLATHTIDPEIAAHNHIDQEYFRRIT